METNLTNLEYSKNLRRVHSEILDLPPSCIEFLPLLPHSPRQYFVVGTYHLQDTAKTTLEVEATRLDSEVDEEDSLPTLPKPQERDGSLSLFSIEGGILTLSDRIPFPAGILDLHFIPSPSLNVFAVASSVGTISIYSVGITSEPPHSGKQAEYKFHHIATHQIFPSNNLVLSITWIPNPSLALDMLTPPALQKPHKLIATLNTGEIYLVDFSGPEFGYSITNDWLPIHTHGAEAWISAVCPSLKHIYTGGDDIQLQIIDINLDELHNDQTEDLFYNEASKVRGHEAGITAILPLPFLETRMFLTGSYDDYIRLFAITSTGQAEKVTELYLGGGVWRLKFLENHGLIGKPEGVLRWMVLASCMHAGAKVLNVVFDGAATWTITEVAHVTEHKSMNYASDVQALHPTNGSGGMIDGDERRICVSTSFYDKLLVVWEFDPTV